MPLQPNYYSMMTKELLRGYRLKVVELLLQEVVGLKAMELKQKSAATALAVTHSMSRWSKKTLISRSLKTRLLRWILLLKPPQPRFKIGESRASLLSSRAVPSIQWSTLLLRIDHRRACLRPSSEEEWLTQLC